MLKEIKIDLADLQDAIEHLADHLDQLPLKSKIDVAARLNAVVKTATKIDKAVKTEIKDHCRNANGEVRGELFKASLAYHPVSRMNMEAFKTERPKIYAAYCETTEEGRITFEPR